MLDDVGARRPFRSARRFSRGRGGIEDPRLDLDRGAGLAGRAQAGVEAEKAVDARRSGSCASRFRKWPCPQPTLEHHRAALGVELAQHAVGDLVEGRGRKAGDTVLVVLVPRRNRPRGLVSKARV